MITGQRGDSVLRLAFCFLVVLCAGQTHAGSWPEVMPLHKNIYVSDARSTSIVFSIVGTQGNELYLMECHTFEYEKDPDFDYSGDFECRLKSTYSKDAYSTLLADNSRSTRDWQSRGRFLAEELEGKCGEYPEFGRVRHFRLRGMNITLALSDIEFRTKKQNRSERHEGPLLKSFRFDVLVEADATASSEIAEPVPYAYPSRRNADPKDMSLNCETVAR